MRYPTGLKSGLSGLWLLFLLSILSYGPSGFATSKNKCLDALFSSNTGSASSPSARSSEFDPMTYLPQRGIDPSKVSFFVDIENNLAIDEIAFYYNGRSVGGSILHSRRKEKIAHFEIIQLKGRKIVGTGFGTAMYLGIAKMLYDQKGLVLQNSGKIGVDTSFEARDLWIRLVDQGYAETFKRGSEDGYRIKKSILQGATLLKARAFIEDRLHPTIGLLTMTDYDAYEPYPILENGVTTRAVISGKNSSEDY